MFFAKNYNNIIYTGTNKINYKISNFIPAHNNNIVKINDKKVWYLYNIGRYSLVITISLVGITYIPNYYITIAMSSNLHIIPTWLPN